jgi:nucleoside-diphosphate-sugar epimerase
MRVIVTGGLGQIGSHVAEMLLARGDHVIVIDNLASGRREHLKDDKNLEVIIDTISDKQLVDRIFSDFKPDAVVHTAASYKDPTDWYNDALTNCVGGANVVDASVSNDVGRFVYFQTALCYGVKPHQQPIELSHPRVPSDSSYAISKTANEWYLELSGIDFVTFRLANVIGPRNVAGPLPIFYQRLKDGKQCFITDARRDFVYVEDLARTVLLALDGVGQGAYHFSSGNDVAIQELYDAVVEAMGLENLEPADLRPLGEDDAYSILLDPSKTFKDFGPIEFTSLKTTVAKGIAYYQKFGTLGEYTHLKMK